MCVARVRRVAPRLLEQGRQCVVASLRTELFDVHPRRHLVHALDVTDDLLEHRADVSRPDEHRPRGLEHPSPPLRELAVAAYRVLELRAVRLHGVRRPRSCADGPARQDVVREDEIGGQQLPHRACVELDVALALGNGQVLELPRLEPFVPVDDEHRQDAADLGADDAGAAEVEPLRVPLLAHHDHVVAGE